MPKEKTKCSSGTTCCSNKNGDQLGGGKWAYGDYFRWTGGYKNNADKYAEYNVEPPTTDICGTEKKGGTQCYNDCCFAQWLWCDNNWNGGFFINGGNPNSPQSELMQVCMHQRGCGKFMFPKYPMGSDTCSSNPNATNYCGPSLTSSAKSKGPQEIKCDSGPKSQCKTLCPNDTDEDITNALSYRNQCAAATDDDMCDSSYYGENANPKRTCS